MPTLECEGVFEVVVPEGWTVTGVPGETYDLSAPEEEDLAVTISVYDREALSARSAAELVRQFAESVTGQDASHLHVNQPAERDQERAFLLFEADGREWMAGFLLFDDGAVLASANTSGDREDLRRGEMLVASIAPLRKRRRRLFRR